MENASFNSPNLKVGEYVVMPDNLEAIEFKIKKRLMYAIVCWIDHAKKYRWEEGSPVIAPC